MVSAPRWFKIASILALLWNLIGLFAFTADASMGSEDVAKLSEAEQAMYAARPVWAFMGTGVATICGTIGSLGLILRKRWALFTLGVSLVGLLAQNAGLLSLPGGLGTIGIVPVVLQGVVLLIAIGLVLLARKAISKQWLT